MVSGEQEVTRDIFKKLEVLTCYFSLFTISILIFKVPLIIVSWISNLHNYATIIARDYAPQLYNETQVVLAVIVGTVSIVFLLMLVANWAIQLLSVVRLINFLTLNKWKRAVMYFLLVPLTLLYTHDVFALLY